MTDGVAPGPADALRTLADELRSAEGQLAGLAHESRSDPVFGPLAATGPRAAAAPAEYSLAIEAIREGYLLHYGEPRVALGADPDLALLAGDYLYALGLARLAALGDVEAVAELAGLISDCAAIHAGDPERTDAERADSGRAAEERWQASAARIGGNPRR